MTTLVASDHCGFAGWPDEAAAATELRRRPAAARRVMHPRWCDTCHRWEIRRRHDR